MPAWQGCLAEAPLRLQLLPRLRVASSSGFWFLSPAGRLRKHRPQAHWNRKTLAKGLSYRRESDSSASSGSLLSWRLAAGPWPQFRRLMNLANAAAGFSRFRDQRRSGAWNSATSLAFDQSTPKLRGNGNVHDLHLTLEREQRPGLGLARLAGPRGMA